MDETDMGMISLRLLSTIGQKANSDGIIDWLSVSEQMDGDA